MLRDITIGQHFPGTSLVHRFDPRMKLVLTIVYIVLLFAASNPLGLTLSILFLALMYKVAQIPFKMILKSLKPILPIVVFTAVLNLFFVSGEGDPLVKLGFLTIYAEGVRYAVLMAVRVMALIAGTSLLTYTTSPIVLTDALEQLLKPLGKLHFPVHALGFKLNFHADTRIPAAKLPLALNQHLPPDIRVLDAQVVPEDFHARYAAHTKTYLYRIHNHPIDSPFDAAYYTRVPRHLDEARMQAAAQQFVGRHDFLALCAAGSSAAAHGDTVRTITDCHVTRKGDEIDIEVTADGYLYNMVRILAGTLCEAGAGRLDPAEIPAILESRDRSRAGPTLPAKGLFLKCVEYDL